MKPLSPETLSKFWDMVEEDKTPMNDMNNCGYASWENEDGVKYHGMKLNATGE